MDTLVGKRSGLQTEVIYSYAHLPSFGLQARVHIARCNIQKLRSYCGEPLGATFVPSKDTPARAALWHLS